MSFKLGVVMDPIERIIPGKDTTLALLLAGQARGWELYYMEPEDLYFLEGQARARARRLQVHDREQDYFSLQEKKEMPLSAMDCLLMRVDPPVTMRYMYLTFLLDFAEREGVPVYNSPAGLRDMNEKIVTTLFPEHTPPTLIAADPELFHEFIQRHGTVVIKPLNAMGGKDVFQLAEGDVNNRGLIDTLTNGGRRHAMMQRFLPEVAAGDKRVILVDGEPLPYAVLRIPPADAIRANLVAGGSYRTVPLDENDQRICAAVGPVLRENKVLLAGLDIIGKWLTEINITSPTCLRELEKGSSIKAADIVLDRIAGKTRR